MSSKKMDTFSPLLDSSYLFNQEKGVDKILNLVKEKIFGDDLNEGNIEEFRKFVRQFTSLYYLMKDKFAEEERSSGERYFEHLRAVVNNVLRLPNPNTKKVLIAIAHDCIEDTNIDFHTLQILNGYEIALGVESISKRDWREYQNFDRKDDREREIEAKKERNRDYFGHLKDFETFRENIISLANSKGILLTEEEQGEIAKNALDVKFADRIHNLTTQWDPNDLDQVRKKVEETKKYFLPIAQETNKEAFEKLQDLVRTLEMQLDGTEGRVRKILG